MSLTWVDWGILAIIGVSALISLRRGFIKEVLSLLIWVAAASMAWLFGGSFAHYLESVIEIPSARVMAGCGLLFVATLMVGGLLSYLLSQLVEATGLTGTDRFLGMAFGAARGALLVVLLVGMASLGPVQQDTWWQQSVLIPEFVRVADWSKNLILDLAGRYVQDLQGRLPVLPTP